MYLIVVGIFLVLSIIAVKLAAVVRSKLVVGEDGSVLDFVMDYPKTCAIIVLVFQLFGAFTVRHHLYNLYDCSVRSASQGVETDYSWYYEKCRFKNQHGIWVDFDKLRGTPSGEEE
ncbi:hypothetical protein [Escherichia phage vB_EcoM_JNE01]|nr:hypothetical protein [Escherichia phage vB_EcoM_JNE01]